MQELILIKFQFNIKIERYENSHEMAEQGGEEGLTDRHEMKLRVTN